MYPIHTPIYTYIYLPPIYLPPHSALREVLEQLLATCGPAAPRHAPALLWIALHLRAPGRAALLLATAPPPHAALAAPPADSAAGGGGTGEGAGVEAALLPRLAEACGYEAGPRGLDALLEAHRAELLAQVRAALCWARSALSSVKACTAAHRLLARVSRSAPARRSSTSHARRLGTAGGARRLAQPRGGRGRAGPAAAAERGRLAGAAVP
jgi:hypothetical protein